MWFGRHSKREQTPKTTRRRSPSKKRALRIEAYEPRLLLAHSAPQLNSALVATFSPIYENQSLTSNGGEAIDTLLASGGPMMTDPANLPLGYDFAFFDTPDGGKEGIAVTGLTGTADGAWEYDPNGSGWKPFAADLSPGNAVLLADSASQASLIRFLPDNGFSGQVTIEFRAWDQSDGQAIGAQVDVNTIGGDGAFSAAATAAKLSVQRDVYAVPTVTLKNYVIDYTNGGNAAAANGLLSGDTDPNAAFDGGMTAQVVSGDGPAFASSFTPYTNGSFNYTPNSSFAGYDQFTYKAVSGPASSAAQTVTIYSHDGAMVQKLFKELLQRSASASDVGYWAPQLQSGSLSMQAFGGDIIESAEHLNKVVTDIYEALLGRAPDASDESYWDQQWTTAGGPSPIWVGVATATECFNYAQTKYPYSDANSNWVALMYQAILNRPVDSTALNDWTHQLDAGTATMTDVVNALLKSTEYYDDMVNDYYQLYLNRLPDSSSQSYWASQLQGGMTQLIFQETLIGVPEYTNNPPAATGGAADPWTP